MNGINPLTWECLDAFARLEGIAPYAHECEALMALDSVLRHPEAGQESNV